MASNEVKNMMIGSTVTFTIHNIIIILNIIIMIGPAQPELPSNFPQRSEAGDPRETQSELLQPDRSPSDSKLCQENLID
jgi:hypothetical protein